MDQLIAALAGGAVLFQDAIHGPSRAKILAFIEQRGVDRGRRAILEALGIQHGANRLAFLRTQSASGTPGGRSSGTDRAGPSTALPIEGSAGHAERVAGRLDADGGGELQDGIH